MCSYDSFSGTPDFTATILQEESGIPIVSVFGEIDLRSAHNLDILMLKAVSEAGEGGSVIVDLCGVEFMDCSGLGVLVRGRSVLGDSGGALAVVCGRRIGRVFEAAGLAEDFGLHEDLGSAVQRCRGLRQVS